MTDTTPRMIADYETIEEYPSELTSLVSRLQTLIDKGYTHFILDSYIDYDCPIAKLEAKRMRLETPQEVEKRIAVNNRYKEQRRKDYERLKAEFEGDAS